MYLLLLSSLKSRATCIHAYVFLVRRPGIIAQFISKILLNDNIIQVKNDQVTSNDFGPIWILFVRQALPTVRLETIDRAPSADHPIAANM